MTYTPSRLKYLADNYFHEDWKDEAPTPAGVVEVFVNEEVDEIVRELWDELMALDTDHIDEARAKEIWTGTHNHYLDPQLVGMTYAEWIAQLTDVIRRAVEAQAE